MSNYGFFVEKDNVPALLAKFKKGMDEINTIKDELLKDTAEMEKKWQGNGSNAVLSGIKEFKKTFEENDERNKEYVKFLDSVIEKYVEEDNRISKDVDSSFL